MFTITSAPHAITVTTIPPPVMAITTLHTIMGMYSSHINTATSAYRTIPDMTTSISIMAMIMFHMISTSNVAQMNTTMIVSTYLCSLSYVFIYEIILLLC